MKAKQKKKISQNQREEIKHYLGGSFTQRNVFYNDPKVHLEKVRMDCKNLHNGPSSSRDNKEIMLAAVKQDGKMLGYASVKLRNDFDVVSAALRQNGLALYWVAIGICSKHPILIELALKQNGQSLQFLNMQDRSNSCLVRIAIEENINAGIYMGVDLTKDKEWFLSMFPHFPQMIQFGDVTLREDREIIKAVVLVRGDCIAYASEKIRDDFEICKLAIFKTPRAFKFISKRLQKNLELWMMSRRSYYKIVDERMQFLQDVTVSFR